MRRKCHSATTSLDLFLDTICNAFGGIMFLSILITIMIQSHGGSEREAESTEVISKDDALGLALQLQQVSNDLAQWQLTVEQLEGAVSEINIEALEALNLRRSALQNELKERIAEKSRTVNEIEAIAERIEDSRTELEATAAMLLESRKGLSESESGLSECLDKLEPKLTPPVVRQTQKGNELFALRYGKIYYVESPWKLGSKSGSFGHVEISQGAFRTYSIRPKESSGWLLSDPRQKSEFLDLLRSMDSSDTFISCAVWPDSFGSFTDFRTAIQELDFEYHLMPVTELDRLTVTVGAGSADVQ